MTAIHGRRTFEDLKLFRFSLMSLAVSAAVMLTSGTASASSIDVRMNDIMASGEATPLAAMAVLKLHNGRPEYAYFSGFARSDQGRTVAVGADTLFRVASISKMVTTIGFMELVEQGKISLDQDVSDYLGFKLRNPNYLSIPITARMLLSHTSSIRDADVYNLPPGQKISSFFDQTHKLGAVNYHFAHEAGRGPGAYFAYCNLCFGLIGTMVEHVTGQRFDLYQKEHVLKPLGIAGGYNVLDIPSSEKLATLYAYGPKGYEAQVDMSPLRGWSNAVLRDYRPGDNGTLFSPQGGLRISVNGLGRLARFMQGRGALGNVRLLSPSSIKLMETPVWQFDGHNGEGAYPISSYGLGVILLNGAVDPSGRPAIPYAGYHGAMKGHLGDAYGLHSGLWYEPEGGNAYIFVADGFPNDTSPKSGVYSSFSRVEEEILTTLSHIKR
ncbi:serine hydrolase [Gluconobacter wancherniae NBRC 103581]|nr:serine hydrolase [Gluconobacter wancherniae NBRC 103581]